MKQHMTIEELFHAVQAQQAVKVDFAADTSKFEMQQFGDMPRGVGMVVLERDSGLLDRYEITENAHQQIAGRLNIPWKYYNRLLADHADLVTHQVNALFQREPEIRLVRTLDKKIRAFLSNQYLRIDNDYVLENALPPIIKGDIGRTKLLSCSVNEENMHLKVLFDDMEIDLGRTARGDAQDIVKPGFYLRNSEVGKGSLSVRGFFYRNYCTNGCVFGSEEMLEFNRTHIGSKLLKDSAYRVLSQETQALEDKAIISTVTDVMKALGDSKFIDQMGAKLRALKAGEQIQQPVAAIEVLGKELGLTQGEQDNALTNLLKDGDLSRWGALNAVTAIANETESYERATELEGLGTKLIDMQLSTWTKIATAERVAA